MYRSLALPMIKQGKMKFDKMNIITKILNFNLVNIINSAKKSSLSLTSQTTESVKSLISQSLVNKISILFNKLNSSLLNLHLHLISTFRRKKIKMKKHQTWKRWKKIRNSQKQNLKKK